jgi:hypothetical protein
MSIEHGTSSAPGRASDSDRCSCGFGIQGSEHVYNEEAFRYFLDIERKRSEVSNRPFLLLLVDLRSPAASGSEIDEPSGAKLFSALAGCLRDTDFIGWYRAGSVVGAVLAQHSVCMPDAQTAVTGRVTRTLRASLPSDLAARFHVRVYLGSSAVHAAKCS